VLGETAYFTTNQTSTKTIEFTRGLSGISVNGVKQSVSKNSVDISVPLTGITVNGAKQNPTNRVISLTIPNLPDFDTLAAQLVNEKEFITQQDLSEFSLDEIALKGKQDVIDEYHKIDYGYISGVKPNSANNYIITLMQGNAQKGQFSLNQEHDDVFTFDPVPITGIQVSGVTQTPTASRIVNINMRNIDIEEWVYYYRYIQSQ
jgi:hypothetical protein